MKSLVRISSVAALAALVALGCRTGVPVVDLSEPPPTRDGTISGTVSAPGQSAPIAGRTVTAISTGLALTFEALSDENGAYTMKVPPGRYRLRIVLREGEEIYKEPGEVKVDESDVEENKDFIIIGAGR